MEYTFFFSSSQATGAQLGLLAAAVVTIIGGLIVGFDASWQLTLVMIAFIPLLIGAGMVFNTFLGGGGGGGDKDGSASEAGQVSYIVVKKL